MPNQFTDVWPSLRAKIEHYLDKQPDGCWLWTRAKSARGYGHVCWQGKVLPAHRAYLKELGWDVPDRMDVDHLCRVTSCCNPDHLEVVTHQVNIQRSPTIGRWKRSRWTACRRGHPWNGPEDYYENPRTGDRYCRHCRRIREGNAARRAIL